MSSPNHRVWLSEWSQILKSEYPTPTERERFQQEYDILRNLEIEGVLRVYGLESEGRTVALVLEDFGGRSLGSLMGDRSVEFIIGMVGILKAGAAYLPLDVEYPDSRIQF